MNVFRAFLFFLGCALVVAFRTVWYGNAADRMASGRAAAREHVASLLIGAKSVRGAAMAALLGGIDVVADQKAKMEFKGASGARPF